MKKYLCLAAMMLESCAPAQSYAVTTEQCSQLHAAYLLARNDKNQDIYDMSRAIYLNFPMLSIAGSVSVADDVKQHANEFMNGSIADRADRAFDKCLSNDLNFNAKYFKGDVK